MSNDTKVVRLSRTDSFKVMSHMTNHRNVFEELPLQEGSEKVSAETGVRVNAPTYGQLRRDLGWRMLKRTAVHPHMVVMREMNERIEALEARVRVLEQFINSDAR